jgi:hypothetical protein
MILTNYGIHNHRYDLSKNSYHDDMEGAGVICLAVDILPTEFSKEVLHLFSLFRRLSIFEKKELIYKAMRSTRHTVLTCVWHSKRPKHTLHQIGLISSSCITHASI